MTRGSRLTRQEILVFAVLLLARQQLVDVAERTIRMQLLEDCQLAVFERPGHPR